MSVSDRLRSLVDSMRAQRACLPDGKVKVRRGYEPPPSLPSLPPGETYRQALADIANRKFIETAKYEEQQWRAVRDGCHQRILDFERLLVKRMRALDVPMFCSTAMRGEADQNSAYVLGHSKAKWRESPHNFGYAVDVIHSVKGWDMTERQWAIVGHVGKEIAIQNALRVRWGGDFRSLWDPAHWELSDWKALRDGL